MSTKRIVVPVPIEKLIYSTHSGRCAFCRGFVFVPSTEYDAPANLGEIAHIRGERPGAARYDPTWTQARINDPVNLMLMCRPHHRQIDAQAATYPVGRLEAMKAEHEKWLEKAIKASPEGRRVERMVLLQDGYSPIDEALALDALAPDYTTMPVRRIDLGPFGDDWAASCQKQRELTESIRGSSLSMAVFAMSSIPATAYLGHLIGNGRSVSLHQFDRDKGTWLWPESPIVRDADMVPLVEGLESGATYRSGPAVLRISLSASTSGPDLGSVASAHIRVGTPSLNWLRSPRQLEEFGLVYRETLDRIEDFAPNCTEIHVLAAVPCGAAFLIGSHHNAKRHPPLIIPKYSRADAYEYSSVLTIP